VPVKRIELLTFGLQNRCSTAELNRRTKLQGSHRRLKGLVCCLPPATGVDGRASRQIPELIEKGYGVRRRGSRENCGNSPESGSAIPRIDTHSCSVSRRGGYRRWRIAGEPPLPLLLRAAAVYLFTPVVGVLARPRRRLQFGGERAALARQRYRYSSTVLRAACDRPVRCYIRRAEIGIRLGEATWRTGYGRRLRFSCCCFPSRD
jgi:hypothetical protein